MAFHHPHLTHLNSMCETWELSCLGNEFTPSAKGPLEADGLRNLHACEVGTTGGSWVDLVTDFRGIFISKQSQELFNNRQILG